MKTNKPTQSTKEQAFKTLQKFIILHILLMEYSQKYIHAYSAFIGFVCAFFTAIAGILFFRLVCALIIAL
jgi:hypothetical protein